MAQIRKLPWVADGVAEDEGNVLGTLIECAHLRPDLFSDLLAKTWLRDGIDVAKGIVINDLCHRYNFSKIRPLDIVEMEFLDSIAVIDSETIGLLANLDNASDAIAASDLEQIVALPWITDGIAPTERTMFEELVKCAEHRSDMFNGLLEKPWFGGNPNADGREIALALCQYARFDESFPMAILEMDFLNHGSEFDGVELAAFWEFLLWSGIYPDARRTLLQNPLLRDDIVSDKEKVIINLLRSAPSNEWVEQIVSHSALRDGISAQDARMLSMIVDLYRIIHSWRSEIEIQLSETGDSLLSLIGSGGLSVETRTIQLPLAGETLLTIIRYKEPEVATMDLLEQAIRFNEAYMGKPSSNDWIVLYIDNEDSGVGIAHHGTHIAMREELEMSGPEGWSVHLPYVLVHETGHSFRLSAPAHTWIAEGVANLLVYLAKREWMGTQAATEYAAYTSPQCHQLDNIAELEDTNTVPEDPYFSCNYEFGVQLFVELHRTLGDVYFQQGFRNLHDESLFDGADTCEGPLLGVCHLLAAFKDGLPPNLAAQVDEIVARHYGQIP